MKRITYLLISLAVLLSACNDYETYGDQKKKERNAISKYIADHSILVISEDLFHQQGDSTSLQRNEYVKFDKSGVYMQIVRRGCGTELADGENVNLVCYFREFDILNDTTRAYNSYYPDIMNVKRTSGSYTASFVSGVMYTAYGASVPSGWLVPLTYIKVGRPQSMTDEVSKVRLIVPHSQGHSTASSYVTPYYYEITFQRES